MIRTSIALLVVFIVTSDSAFAEDYELNFDQGPGSAFLDRWMYPFNITPGTRIQAPTFGALGSEGFDDRDGQFLIAINTEQIGIPTGMPPQNYQIDLVRMTLTEGVGGYPFDPTYDPFRTFLESSVDIAEADEDSGRPIELYGAGFRNGYETFGWPDGATSTEAPTFSAASPFGVNERGTRNVFAADAAGNDVSNNVDSLNSGADGFDPTPFGIGQAVGDDELPLPPGTLVEANTPVRFDIDVADAQIRTYLQEGLADGQLGFVITSLNSTGQQGAGDPFVNLATANHFATAGPKFEISVSIVDVAVPGDYDQDGTLGVADISLLVAEIASGTPDPFFDANGDTIVDASDLVVWINELFGSYVGDANLDGEFNSGDFVHVFAAGEYEDQVVANSTWSTGDWNGDREFDSSDFVAAFQSGGYEIGPRAKLGVVPEPTSAASIFGMFACVVWLRRRARSSRLA